MITLCGETVDPDRVLLAGGLVDARFYYLRDTLLERGITQHLHDYNAMINGGYVTIYLEPVSNQMFPNMTHVATVSILPLGWKVLNEDQNRRN